MSITVFAKNNVGLKPWPKSDQSSNGKGPKVRIPRSYIIN